MSSFLRYVPPMGIYKTLYAFRDTFGAYMGAPGSHPWSQGFPRTDQLPGGPAMPVSVDVTGDDLKYPKAWGLPALREAIAGYYQQHYGAEISSENVMVFAGGRPAIMAVLLFLEQNIQVRIASTEYTPYYDILEGLGRPYTAVPSTVENDFAPTVDDYVTVPEADTRSLVIASNPCNPTGKTRAGGDLADLVSACSGEKVGMMIDEAYELFHEPPVSALSHVRDIDDTNLFVIGAATKGLQAPGIRIGWVVAAERHIEILGNFSSFGMGGVSHPSQRYAVELLAADRVALARKAVPSFYGEQRARYGEAFERLGLELYSGTGGFYHWCRIPNGASAAALNRQLFPKGAAILEGTDCDMLRRGDDSPLQSFFRFSFGPLAPESFTHDIEILREAIDSL